MVNGIIKKIQNRPMKKNKNIKNNNIEMKNISTSANTKFI